MALNDNSPRMEWPTGIVTEATRDTDGLVRKVKILMCAKDIDEKGKRKGSCTVLERPIQKIVALLEA